MLGYSAEEVGSADLWWNHLVHPNDRYRVQLELQALLQGTTRFYAVEHRIGTKTEGWICIRHAVQVVRYDREGAPLRMFGTFRVPAPSDETLGQFQERLHRVYESQVDEVSGWAECCTPTTGHEPTRLSDGARVEIIPVSSPDGSCEWRLKCLKSK